MSKATNRNFKGPVTSQEPPAMSGRPLEPSPATGPEIEAKRIPQGLQEPCPICSGNLGGIGQTNGIYAKAQTVRTRYFKCDRCQHTWSRQV